MSELENLKNRVYRNISGVLGVGQTATHTHFQTELNNPDVIGSNALSGSPVTPSIRLSEKAELPLSSPTALA